MKDRKTLILSILSILLLIGVTVGISLAFFNYAQAGTTDNTLETGNITFLYTETSSVGRGIAIEDAFPISNEEGKLLTGEGNAFDFNISSTTQSNTNIPFEVTARKNDSSTLSEDAVVMYLTKVNGTNEEEILLDKYSNLIQTEKVNNYVEKTLYNGTVYSNNTYDQDYRLRMWITNDGTFESEDMGKTFTVTVNVYANATVVTESQIALENNTNINKLSVNDAEIIKVEDKNYDYLATLSGGTTSATLNIETEVPDAKVKVEKLNNLVKSNSITRVSTQITLDNLVEGTNLFKVIVSSANNKVEKEYVLRVQVGDNIYIYNNGEIDTEVAGNILSSTQAYGFIYFENNYINMTANYSMNFGKTIYTEYPIDLSNYKKIHVKFSVSGGSADEYYRRLTLSLRDSDNNTTSFSASYTGGNITDEELELDVKTINGSYYIYIDGGSYKDLHIQEIWLESSGQLCEVGNVWEYTYVNGEQTFNAPCSGTYKLETWGSQGGGVSQYTGGYGAYAVGNINLNSNNKLYVNVGGAGLSGGNGGYNGGGSNTGSQYGYGGTGGGATHIATESGLLSTFSNDISKILIVAGSGGGGAKENAYIGYCYGGHAGGVTGSQGSNNPNRGNGGGSPGTAGTQTTGYAFGQGADSFTWDGGGGAGLYGGNAGCGGAGGSSYIGNSLLTNKAMYCYNCEESNEVNTKTISNTCHSSAPTENCAKESNGYARITLVSLN